MRLLAVALAGAAALLFAPTIPAKDFKPGDLRVCNARRCVPLTSPRVVPLLGRFYYSSGRPPVVSPPRMGAPGFELKFVNGYATGIAAGAHFDRFLSYGVNLERFRKGTWYRVPPRLAAELQRLSASLAPLRVTPATLLKSH